MSVLRRIEHVLLGSEPKLRRLLGYWAATLVFYLVSLTFLWVEVAVGESTLRSGIGLTMGGVIGVCLFYLVIRNCARLGIEMWQVAFGQAVFAIVVTATGYGLVVPIRGAALVVPLVVMVFCAFSLRPRQNYVLCAITILAMGSAMLRVALIDPARHPAHIEALHFAFLSISMVAVTLLTAELSKLRSRLKQQKKDMVDAMATIHTLATIDELTTLANRRHMQEVLRVEERRQSTLGQPICMALLDIDFFKNINDKYGHAAGDAVLRDFALRALLGLRSADVLARWGGEEFLLLLPDTELEEAKLVLNRMSERIGAMRVAEVDPELRVTFSGGVVARRSGEPFTDAIKRADEAMYVAKSCGRDRINAA